MQIDLNKSSQQIANLLASVQLGEEVVFIRNGEFVAKMNKVGSTLKIKRKSGLLKGRKLDSRFFEPLDKEELELW